MKSNKRKVNKIKNSITIKTVFFIILIFLLSSFYLKKSNILFTNKYLNNINLEKWIKYEKNPILGGNFGTIFDVNVLKIKNIYYMFSSWRPKKSIAISVSYDGIIWSDPKIILSPKKSLFEDDLNRPGVVYKDNIFHLWFTIQNFTGSYINYAKSNNNLVFERCSKIPILIPEKKWEKKNVMCPHVLWDTQENIFKMYYSGGDKSEPNSIGYAISKDGIIWKKNINNPIFLPINSSNWERYKVGACYIHKRKSDYLMFYIGYQSETEAKIGLAKSKNGITNWERFKNNPIITPSKGEWDEDSTYKPSVIFDRNHWKLYYNGRRKSFEQIGLAFHRKNLNF